MSMFGHGAVVAELRALLKLLDDMQHETAEEKLKRLRERIERDLAAADSGWL